MFIQDWQVVYGGMAGRGHGWDVEHLRSLGARCVCTLLQTNMCTDNWYRTWYHHRISWLVWLVWDETSTVSPSADSQGWPRSLLVTRDHGFDAWGAGSSWRSDGLQLQPWEKLHTESRGGEWRAGDGFRTAAGGDPGDEARRHRGRVRDQHVRDDVPRWHPPGVPAAGRGLGTHPQVCTSAARTPSAGSPAAAPLSRGGPCLSYPVFGVHRSLRMDRRTLSGDIEW